MNNQFSLDVRQVVSHMENIAFKLHHNVVRSEHLLLGLLSFENILSLELKRYKVTYDQIYKKVKELLQVDNNQLLLHLEYNKELMGIFDKAKNISLKYKEKNISILSLSLAFINFDDGEHLEFLKKYRIDFKELNNYLLSLIKRDSDLLNINDLHLMNREKDPLIGREDELKQLIMVLSRRNKPNAILIGEPGVGKTAIVEELARLLNENKIPALKNKTIYELDLASTVGGTKYRGEFEEKIKKILKKVIEDGNAILFIDEIHNIVKAGGAEGAIDAANILKPYLSRNEIQIIGATTINEFQTIFEKDAALKRRFQIINIKPNSTSETKEILKRNKEVYENFYNIKIDDEMIDYIVDLADIILPNYYFPDKAIDILDNACTLVDDKLTKTSINNAVELFYKVKIKRNNNCENVINNIKDSLVVTDDVLTKIEKNLKIVDHSFCDKNRPLRSLMFVGPCGVGKNSIANIIGKEYFSSEDIFYLNMSSYQDAYGLSRLLSKTNDEDSSFVKFIKNHPSSLIVINEFEKANNNVLDLFFNIVDKGYFENAKGEIISCKHAMFIFVSNYGFDNQNIFINEEVISLNDNYIIKKLANRFKDEFLSRLDDIVVFNYLDHNTRTVVAKKYLKYLGEDPDKHDVCNMLVHSDNDYNKSGARLIHKDIKTAIINNLMKN